MPVLDRIYGVVFLYQNQINLNEISNAFYGPI